MLDSMAIELSDDKEGLCVGEDQIRPSSRRGLRP
jgi:hypothetical protein